MTLRRDTVTTRTTRTPEGGPVRWWLLIAGLVGVMTLLTAGFAWSVQRATIADAKDALAAAGLSGVTVEGATYRDVRLAGPEADEAAARAALAGIALPYGVSYDGADSADGPTASESPVAEPSPSVVPDEPSASPSATASATASANPEPVELPGLPDLAGVQFETASATLTGPSTVILDQAAAALTEALAARPGLRVAVNGHTDNQGDAAANVTLSQQRAQAVLDYLVSKGVPASALSATGYGAANPIQTNDTADGRAANRRVEFIITEG